MAVVTISRQFGAGGHTLGTTLAEKLGYQLVDREILKQIAEEAKVSIKWVEAVEKEAGGLLMRLVNSMVSASFIDRLIGEERADFDEKKYLSFVRRIITDIGDEGNAVIVGRGAQFILPDREDVIKILLVAELKDRIKFMSRHYDLNRNRAEDLVRREDKRRSTILGIFHSGNPDKPHLYTLVFNTSSISMEEAEDTIVNLVGRINEVRQAS
ncbi:MAG: AAA family ATPase [Desulfatibacillaceae bacterium]